MYWTSSEIPSSTKTLHVAHKLEINDASHLSWPPSSVALLASATSLLTYDANYTTSVEGSQAAHLKIQLALG